MAHGTADGSIAAPPRPEPAAIAPPAGPARTRLCRVTRLLAAVMLALWAGLAAVGALVTLRPSEYRPLVGPDGWAARDFFTNETLGGRPLPRAMLEAPELRLWRSWTPERGALAGEITSAPFMAPAYFAIPFTGFPGESADHDIGLRCAASGAERSLGIGRINNEWGLRVVRSDPGFCAGPIAVYARSGGNFLHVGIGTPFATDWFGYASQLYAYTLPFFALIAALSLTAPLLLIAALLPARLAPAPRFLAALTLLCAGAMGLFLVFHVSASGGRHASIALVGGSAVALLALALARSPRLEAGLGIRPYLTASALLMLAYLGFVAAFQPDAAQWTVNGMFRPLRWSTDNQIPGKVAEAFFNAGDRASLSPIAPWRIGDRPPLLSVLMLIPRSLARLIGMPAALRDPFYLAAGITVMCLWLGVAIAFVEDLAGRRRLALLACAPLAVAPAFFFNTVFIWPKMLSAALGLIAVWGLLRARSAEDGRSATLHLTLAGAAAAGAALFHTGVVIGLIPFGVLALGLIGRRWRGLLAGTLAFAIVYAPWLWWQSAVQPGVNALLRTGLTGDLDIGDRTTTVLQALARTYGRIGVDEWLGMKAYGLRELFLMPDAKNCVIVEMGPFWRGLDATGIARIADFTSLGFSLKFFFAGLAAALLLRWLRPAPARSAEGGHLALLFIVMGLIGALLQIPLLWVCHVIHQLSYVSLMLLALGITLAMARTAPALVGVLAAVEAAYLLAVWLVPAALGAVGLSVAPLIMAGLAFAVLALVLLGGVYQTTAGK